MTDDLALGIDLSHHQDPRRIAWGELARSHSFVIVRACYGSKRDRLAYEHVNRARAVGLAVGLYLFMRPTEDAVSQWGTFAEVASSVRLGPGDLWPALDLEDDPPVTLGPEHSETARTLADALAGRWGGCLLYGNANDFAKLGNPAWTEQHAIWTAHWTQASEPRCPPGRDWRIWQRRVSVMPSIYSGKLDQNVARRPLPTILDPDQERRRVEGVIATTLRSTGKPDA